MKLSKEIIYISISLSLVYGIYQFNNYLKEEVNQKEERMNESELIDILRNSHVGSAF